ncbi:hypothetical protein OAW23_07290 [Flavobacteriales bacterium]|nr:hypothetical protein [Flavobacteriales bacterium]
MLTQEKNEKLMFSEKVGFNLSNLEKALNKAPELSSMWAKGNLAEKRKIQKMVFPDGIEYDHKNDEYRTFRVNSFFSYIPAVSKELGHKKTGKFRVKTKNSGSVPLTVQLSNTFYENLYELYDLRQVLINEGVMDNDGFILPMTDLQSNSTIPYGN